MGILSRVRYATNLKLPGRRYLPGQGMPRPVLDLASADEALTRATFRDHHALGAGLDLFNRGFFWEAHELWEAAWKVSSGHERELLQGLIQLAAAALQAVLGNTDGSERIRIRAEAHLKVARESGAIFCGFDLDYLADDAAAGEIRWRRRSRDLFSTPTDLLVQPLECRFSICDGGIVQVLSSRTDYFSGNAIHLDAPIDPSDRNQVDFWRQRCRALLPESARYHNLSWEREDADDQQAADGNLDRLVALRSNQVGEPMKPNGIVIRELEGDRDWDAVTALSIEVNEPQFGIACRPFTRWRYRCFRETVSLLGGAFFGAFDGDDLAAALGAVAFGRAFRYQEVQTRIAFRRRGIARALVAHAYAAMRARGHEYGLIVADTGGIAERLYSGIGFEPITVNRYLQFKLGEESVP